MKNQNESWVARNDSGIGECMVFLENHGKSLGLTAGAVMTACAAVTYGMGVLSEHEVIANHLQSIGNNLGMTGLVTATGFWATAFATKKPATAAAMDHGKAFRTGENCDDEDEERQSLRVG